MLAQRAQAVRVREASRPRAAAARRLPQVRLRPQRPPRPRRGLRRARLACRSPTSTPSDVLFFVRSIGHEPHLYATPSLSSCSPRRSVAEDAEALAALDAAGESAAAHRAARRVGRRARHEGAAADAIVDAHRWWAAARRVGCVARRPASPRGRRVAPPPPRRHRAAVGAAELRRCSCAASARACRPSASSRPSLWRRRRARWGEQAQQVPRGRSQMVESDFSWMRQSKDNGSMNPRTTRTSCFYDFTRGTVGTQGARRCGWRGAASGCASSKARRACHDFKGFWEHLCGAARRRPQKRRALPRPCITSSTP